MSDPTSGWVVLRSDSVQPVHSWKCSQTIDGFFLPTFSAIFSPAQAGRPTAAAAAEQTLMKSRRETPLVSSSVIIGAFEFMQSSGCGGDYRRGLVLQPCKIPRPFRKIG